MISLQSVSKTYQMGPSKVFALREVTTEIGKGEFTAIAGPSGSGKSTLLNLTGFLDEADKGSRIYIEGKEVTSRHRNDLADLRRHRIGFIFQSYNLIPVLTAFENVSFGLSLLGKSTTEIKERVMTIFEQTGITGMENRRPSELSGGQQQRVAIARALIKNPALVLADEPTANLDSDTGKDIIMLMRQLNEQLNTTFVISSHDPQMLQYTRRIIYLKDGRIVEDKKY